MGLLWDQTLDRRELSCSDPRKLEGYWGSGHGQSGEQVMVNRASKRCRQIHLVTSGESLASYRD